MNALEKVGINYISEKAEIINESLLKLTSMSLYMKDDDKAKSMEHEVSEAYSALNDINNTIEALKSDEL